MPAASAACLGSVRGRRYLFQMGSPLLAAPSSWDVKINCQSLFTAVQAGNTEDFRLNCQLTEFKIEERTGPAAFSLRVGREMRLAGGGGGPTEAGGGRGAGGPGQRASPRQGPRARPGLRRCRQEPREPSPTLACRCQPAGSVSPGVRAPPTRPGTSLGARLRLKTRELAGLGLDGSPRCRLRPGASHVQTQGVGGAPCTPPCRQSGPRVGAVPPDPRPPSRPRTGPGHWPEPRLAVDRGGRPVRPWQEDRKAGSPWHRQGNQRTSRLASPVSRRRGSLA